ncbi:hypothetical protein [Pseudonocardia sp. EV170527-09]|uniref:hypothetical protein n=1 Tax=Pseudonocardia sp. EV170527-09 TaxID=2603411 RepID=UPI00351A8289
MGFVLARVERAVAPLRHADAVDAQQGAVEDDERLALGDLDRLLERGCLGSEQIEGLPDVAVDGRGAELDGLI